MYVITGITGQVGGAVARTLLGAGRPVRAIVRDARKGAAWAERGCDVALADLNDAAALASAFKGAQRRLCHGSADIRSSARFSRGAGALCRASNCA
ncbi:protein of unknown function (plasmid) [Methylocella tundrae]|uniref:NmrA-like domain-containing protein n=1 Tax=Methylocella tundrae TaxID=227605 RepID=A0A4U8Z6Z7_METTU|nr:protein of unknown function [Methylocella tundrae]